MIERLCVIGVGLIGGSIAQAAREKGLCRSIIGVDSNRRNLEQAQALEVIDQGVSDVDEGAGAADFIVVATPVGAVEEVFSALRRCWSDNAVYTDVCSTKRSVVEAVRAVFGFVPDNFVPAHPIAGAECSGVGASRPDLYRGKRVIVTPLPYTHRTALAKVTAFWGGLGAEVSTMEAAHHDEVLAATSHLPHVVAYALVDMLRKKDEKREILQFAAGGFRDFTRIASSDPRMWLDICMANRDEIVPLIKQLSVELEAIADMIDNNAADELLETFRCANSARERFLNHFAS
jgi:prephenate dehydrogenase